MRPGPSFFLGVCPGFDPPALQHLYRKSAVRGPDKVIARTRSGGFFGRGLLFLLRRIVLSGVARAGSLPFGWSGVAFFGNPF